MSRQTSKAYFSDEMVHHHEFLGLESRDVVSVSRRNFKRLGLVKMWEGRSLGLKIKRLALQ